MYVRIIIALLLGFAVAGCFQDSFGATLNSTVDSNGNYVNPSLGISFHAPPGWAVEEPKNVQPDAPDVAVIAPYSNGFTASISLTVEKSNVTTLDGYVKSKVGQLEKSNQTGAVVLLSEQDGTLAGLPAKVLLLQENFTSNGTSNAVKFKQTVVKTDDKIYTMTYANDKGDFDSGLSNYDALLASTKFGNGGESFPFDYLSIGIVGVALAAGMIMTMRKKRADKQNANTAEKA